MTLRTDQQLLMSRLGCLAIAFVAMIIYSGDGTSGRIRVRAFGNVSVYLSLTLMTQFSVCLLELFGQVVNMYLGSTTPVPERISLCLLLILADWLLAFFTVGTACASLGILTFLISNGIYARDVNIRAIFHCVLSLVAGALATLSAYFTSLLAKSRWLRLRSQE